MSARYHPVRATPAARQRGQTIFLAAVFLLFGISAALYATLGTSANSVANRQAEHDAKVLAQVKEALIGWSAARTPTASNPNARPGELPCPDTDNNGFAENDDNNDGIDEASCAAGTIGRVPWKTLGIPEPKDSTGETLWYAISGNFRVYRSASPNSFTSAITSDTLGTLRVDQDSTSNTITSQAIAVIFAPGVALDTQDRSTTTTMSCSAPSGTYFRNQCAFNYLDSYGGVNNYTANNQFIRGPSSSTFNDRLLVITNADLMPAVEQRVAREIISILQQYKVATSSSTLASLLPGIGVYPWADRSDGGANTGWNHNRFPCGSALPFDWDTVPTQGTQATPTLPEWLKNGCDCTSAGQRGWACVILYAVAKIKLEDSGAACNEVCNADTLTVTNPGSRPADVCLASVSPFACTPTVVGTVSADVVLITSGAATASRSSGWPNTTFTDPITLYFEDSENGVNNSDSYTVPRSTNYDRDRIYIIR